MPEEKDEKGRDEKGHDEKGRPVERERRHDEKGRPVERERRHDEKGNHDEKGEKYRRDPFSAIFLGLFILMVAALWFLRREGIIVSGEWWQWGMVGLGSIVIIDRLIRYASPVHRRPMFGRIIVGAILIGVGVSLIHGIETWWPIIVGVVGVAVIIYGIRMATKPRT